MKKLLLLVIAIASLHLISCKKAPVVNISVDSSSTKRSGDETRFDNESKNAEEYNWDFGDGNTSTDKEPTHIYEESGTYTVNVEGINGGWSSNKSIDVEIKPGAYEKLTCCGGYSYSNGVIYEYENNVLIQTTNVDYTQSGRVDLDLDGRYSTSNLENAFFLAGLSGDMDFSTDDTRGKTWSLDQIDKEIVINNITYTLSNETDDTNWKIDFSGSHEYSLNGSTYKTVHEFTLSGWTY